ncbi:hypothetical protein SSX86_016054 [Deinandra increscens subsp. villosa]|uniref:RRM domain-containing protein n=1 Tax=Deinandra increscens subsp. villosa TaxID=3103831 RepID=A0AAP0D204_9ASTR
MVRESAKGHGGEHGYGGKGYGGEHGYGGKHGYVGAQEHNDIQDFNDGPWTTVTHQAKGTEAVTFYLADLPNGCSGEYLWRCYQHMGRIADAFVPRRKDWRGRTFGFVRFRGVMDEEKMLERLRTVRVDGARVRVYVSKFGKGDSGRRGRNSERTEHLSQKQPNTEGWKRTQAWNQPKTVRVENLRVFRDETTVGLRQQAWKGPSVTKANNGARKENTTRCLRLEQRPGLYPLHCVGRSLIGEVLSLDLIEDIRYVMGDAGFDNVAISYVGGVKVLLTFKDREVAFKFLSESKKWWEKVFGKLKYWDGREQDTERVARLKIAGIPLLQRDNLIFDQVGLMFGKLAKPSEYSWADDDNSVGICHILTSELDWINEVINVEWDNRVFAVWVTEDSEKWCPPVLNDPPKPANVPTEVSASMVKRNKRAQLNVAQGCSEAPANIGGGPVEANGGHGSSNTPGSIGENERSRSMVSRTGDDGGGASKTKTNDGTSRMKEKTDASSRVPESGEKNMGGEKAVTSKHAGGANVPGHQENLGEGCGPDLGRSNERPNGEKICKPNGLSGDCGPGGSKENEKEVDGSGRSDSKVEQDKNRVGEKFNFTTNSDVPEEAHTDDDSDEDWEVGSYVSLPCFRRAKKAGRRAKGSPIPGRRETMRGGSKAAIGGSLSKGHSVSTSRTHSEVMVNRKALRREMWEQAEADRTIEVGNLVGINMNGFHKEVRAIIQEEGVNAKPQ